MGEEMMDTKHAKLKPGRPKIKYDLKKILALRESGLSIRKIAKVVGFSKSKIQIILQNA